MIESCTCLCSVRAESLNKTILAVQPKCCFVSSIFRVPDMRQTLHRVSRLIPLVSPGVKVHLECAYSAFIVPKHGNKGEYDCAGTAAPYSHLSLQRYQAALWRTNYRKLSAHRAALGVLWLFHIAKDIKLMVFRDLVRIVMLEKVCECGALLLLNSFSCQSDSPWRQMWPFPWNNINKMC